MRLAKFIACAALTVFLAVAIAAAPDAVQKKPVIQLCILLDTSNSMDGLIDQARTQLWRVVNQFATAKRDGRSPELQVALYEYGNDGLPAHGERSTSTGCHPSMLPENPGRLDASTRATG